MNPSGRELRYSYGDAGSCVFHRATMFWLLLVAFSGALHSGTVGTLEGIIRDKDNPVVGATVLLVGTSIGRASDVNGHFVIYNIPAGKYSVRVQMIGYKTMVLELDQSSPYKSHPTKLNPSMTDWILMRNPKRTLGKIVRWCKARATKMIHDSGQKGFQ